MISPETRPKLARHVRIDYDVRRKRWVLLAPERLFVPDEAALEVLCRCTGEQSIREIADELAVCFESDPQAIETDVRELLNELADKGVVQS